MMMLTDSFHRIHDYLRIAITQKCNFRCSYCNPVDLPKGYFSGVTRMSVDEIDTLAGIFIQQGIRRIRLTGGEPLVRKDAGMIIQRLSRYPVELTLTTNGFLLADYLEVIKNAGIRSVNVSLDSLNPYTFNKTTGRDEWNTVWENIMLLIKNGIEAKINTVIIQDVNHHEIPDFVALTKNNALQVRFIEFMPFLGNGWASGKVFPAEAMLSMIRRLHPVIKLQDEFHDTARKYMVDGYSGSFATICTMSRPFCSGCNRIRLTADGKMKNCLFSNGEADLLGTLRAGGDVERMIRICLADKKPETGGQLFPDYNLIESDMLLNRSMIKIGG